ncbi:MAG TPA: hypothetical protein VHN10_05435 [Candidatus Acidoferrales bacterium]|jgi:hypothetical protein|nr:hypothetical protein [Candidatus Acidoferrales bacterium]
MLNKTRILRFVPAFCALLIVLRLSVLKSAATSDISLGVSVGILLGLSILSFLLLKPRPS